MYSTDTLPFLHALYGSVQGFVTLTALTKSHSRHSLPFETRATRTGAIVEMLNNQISSLLDGQLAQGERGPQQFADIGQR